MEMFLKKYFSHLKDTKRAKGAFEDRFLEKIRKIPKFLMERRIILAKNTIFSTYQL